MTVHGSYSADGTTGIGVALADIRAEKVQFIPHGTGLLFPRVGGFENQSLEESAVPVKTTKKRDRLPTSAIETVRQDPCGHDETVTGIPPQRISLFRHRAGSW
ncbi:hypothetical protein [Labrenzia sp. THAF82]|uniref:hypothetical protein n=1 Tax=Labrenzia sp. THAF82 TaxID=2587861 RepID=UPI0012695600|nr:hypothetical protein [Labrenzia sp. THAF82]